MKFTKEDVFQQALEDCNAATIKGNGYTSCFNYGCKITHNIEDNVFILENTSMGGDYYRELTEDQIKHFLLEGWKYGVYMLCITNTKKRLDNIERSVRSEVNGRQNPKMMSYLKNLRTTLLLKYNLLSKKINNYEQKN